jgi:hypothetical protein
MGGVTKSDFEWRFTFEKSTLKVEFQKRLFVFPVGPAWRFNLELFCVLVCFCEAIWFRVKVQSWDFLHFGLFWWGLLTPNEGSVWVVLCWMAPSFPPTCENKCKFLTYLGSVSPWIFSFYENGPSKKNFPLRGPGFGGRASRATRARRARSARSALYIFIPSLILS